MIFSGNLVQEYQKEYQRKFGEDISPKDAEREMLDLKELVRLILRERRQHHGK